MEKFFIEKLKLTNNYSNIGTYWEKGNQNEIDIVAVNDELKTMLLVEVKINPKKISIEKLKTKAAKLIQKHPKYEVEFQGLSLENI